MSTIGKVTVERLGGLAGFGSPGSALKSIGTVEMSDLPKQDLDTLNALFNDRPSKIPNQTADDFHYRLTRQTSAGEQSIEVPASAVPHTVTSVAKDGFA